ncbi:MAG: adenosylcobinamide-GDP ribazoletransferase [Candidatus Bathyarchaeota archaeon]|nr:adenosylcobinamide-GDP ribazoletransferase [Candidatus Bathyarchaeota archaeon]MCX8177499.1 adenosylcobinamide-GDP ribazoletransferase [Candidatus Bathyarchaeota archaeon]MDW8194166.1 adenosylcobinamide-GDP ribazoletransferase [Nitrososphaerota archaeon]
MKALEVFKDLLSFLTVIPLAKSESFLETSAKYMFLFPLIGGFMGLLISTYNYVSKLLLAFMFSLFDSFLVLPESILIRIFSAGTTLAFILVLTGLQHFDGLVDVGNVVGLRKMDERIKIAHAWIVTFRGAFFAVLIETLTFLGIFIIADLVFTAKALICSEVFAKLAMVTVAWIGKPGDSGLGSLFAKFNSKKRLNIIAYIISTSVTLPLLGLLSLMLTAIILLLGLLMERVSEKLFGRVSGDVIGATNEIARATSLLLIALLGGL